MPGAGLVISPSTLTFIKILGCSHCIHFFFLNFIYGFSFGCAGSSLLRGLFSRFSEQGPLLVAVLGLLIAVTFLAAEHGL